MFKIVRNTTTPSNTISPTSISVPCFQLTNSLPTLTNFSPMFQLEHINEVTETVDDFVFSISTVPSQYQVVELDILPTNIIDDLDNLYFNGSKYQNLLSLDEFSFVSDVDDSLVPEVDSLPIEEREST